MYLVVSGGFTPPPPPPIIMNYFHVKSLAYIILGQNGFPKDPMHPKNEYPKHGIWISLKRNGYTWY